jgi:hypothetical protein
MYSRNHLLPSIRSAGRSVRHQDRRASKLFDANGNWIVAMATALGLSSIFTGLTEHLSLHVWPTVLSLALPVVLALATAVNVIPKRWPRTRVFVLTLIAVALLDVLALTIDWAGYSAQQRQAATRACLTAVAPDASKREPTSIATTVGKYVAAVCREVAADHS